MCVRHIPSPLDAAGCKVSIHIMPKYIYAGSWFVQVVGRNCNMQAVSIAQGLDFASVCVYTIWGFVSNVNLPEVCVYVTPVL